MLFRIANTFTESLARLTGDEQKAAKTTAFDLQLNPASPGLRFHKLDRARDKNFWSVRVGSDIRLIVHRSNNSLLLCYVDHHDRAYQWAERRRLETHPATGAAQFVEVIERVDQTLIATAAGAPPKQPVLPTLQSAKPLIFARVSDEDLLAWGVPPDWFSEVRQAEEDSVLDLADHLPGEAAEALLEFATGGTPKPAQAAAAGSDPFAHPDAQRRFRIVQDTEALQQALDYPWDQWTVFLHPAQRDWVERNYSGPAKVAGSAGTGKTIVALHRAAHLARVDDNARVLLTTFSRSLAAALHGRLRRLLGRSPMLAERIDVLAIDDLGERLYRFAFGKPQLATPAVVQEKLRQSANAVGASHKFSAGFWWAEWNEVIDPWQIDTEASYLAFKRLGRKTRLSESDRKVAWRVFETVRTELRAKGLITQSALFTALAHHYGKSGKSPFEHVIVDEAQDLSVPQLKFLASMVGDASNGLFFAGDLGQRIFQVPFSWKSLGVETRGRSRTLKVNYRTSHQIRTRADSLLDPEVSDVDGNTESRRGTVSVFNGPHPAMLAAESPQEEVNAVGQWIAKCVSVGIRPAEIAVFVRTEQQIDRAVGAVKVAGQNHHLLDDSVDTDREEVSVGLMHLAKGLEFRCVAVMACDDEVLPLHSRLQEAADESDLQEVYNSERHLLYVACTRARDQLHVSGSQPVSEFLTDLLAW